MSPRPTSGPRAVLRSKTPAMVEQEVWAHLLVHYAIRKLMHQAACDQGLATRRFPPDQAAHATRLAIAEILTERLPPRRLPTGPGPSPPDQTPKPSSSSPDRAKGLRQ
jgi:hypothetical protein